MNAQTTLDRILVALGQQEAPVETVEVKFEQRKMADQEVTFEADSFEAGQEVFVTNEDEERIPAPEGEYEMEDGSYMAVDDKGVIMGYGPKEEEAEAEEPQEAEMGHGGEEVEASVEGEGAQPKRVIQTESVSVETQFASQLEEVEVKFKAEKTELETKIAELEATKLELSAEVEELKNRLAEEPASAPLKHNVEGTTAKREAFYRTAGSKVNTLQNKVYARINK